MLFFSIIIGILILLVVLLIASKIKIVINYAELLYEENKFSIKYNGFIGVFIFNKIKILSFRISDSNIKKLKMNNFVKKNISKLKTLNKMQRKSQRKTALEFIKEIIKQVSLNKINLKICVDTESIMLTSYIVGAISTIIPNWLQSHIKEYKKEKYLFNITTPYKLKNSIHIEISSIISIKLVHIINMLIKMGGIKYERTSYRRFNAKCYGKY